MAYDEQILRRARERFEAERTERRKTLEGRRENLYCRQPRLREIETELRKTSGRILAAALRRGGDMQKAAQELREQNLKLQAERGAILKRLRLPPDYLNERPACLLCQDSGYLDDGRMCQCLLDCCAKEQRKELSKMLDLGSQSFDTFSLHWYSNRTDWEPVPDAAEGEQDADVAERWPDPPQENMKRIYKICVDYARHFKPGAENLLFFGSPGLGKTFLSAAIAREVSAAGFSVVYDSATRIFRQFEAEKFDREEGADRDVSRVLRCDLLILDDLGTEMRTAFTISALYQIVNTRLIERRATILNTNKAPEELSELYSPQIASRIAGEYKILGFFGEDIRDLRKKRKGKPPY